MKISFVWDKEKNSSNLKKHGISFDEAATIFRHFPLEVYHDPEHSDDEDRYIAIGFSDKARVLLVVHLENEKGTEIRILSARKATKKEQKSAFGGHL